MEAAIRPTPAVPDTGDASGVSTLLRMLGSTHRYAHAHAARVSSLAVAIGRELGLCEDDLEDLELAGTLHDIGKLCIPAPIVDKRGPLSDEEWTLVRCHPVEGERLLRPFVRRREVLAAVRWHHERWDGDGYPDGLCGAATPLCARIVAVADAYCAMVEERPYRPPLSTGVSAAEISRNAGSQFDRECASALVTTLQVLAGPDGRRATGSAGRRAPGR